MLKNNLVKRVLIITYYWPPAGGPGVQRWLNFVKYLGDFGIEPVVYVPENPNYPITDEDLLDQVPQDVEVLKLPIKEPYRFARALSKKKTQRMSSGIISEKSPSAIDKMMLYVRGNYFIPDARVGWVNPSVTFLKEILVQKNIEMVITTGPPHSLHLIGLRLKEIMDIRWIADFRDPWTTIHYHKSLQLTTASEKKHKKLEAEVLQGADQVIVTSETTKKEFSEITRKPIQVITNGYETLGEVDVNPDTKFSLAHIGSLLSERNPEVLWQVLSELCSENKDFHENLLIKLVGVVSEEVQGSIRKHGLDGHTEIVGYVPHSEARQLQHNARVLLLLEMDKPETRAIIPGKLFEYLAARRPILAIGPAGSDIEKILEETRSGSFFSPAQRSQLKERLLALFNDFQQGQLQIQPKGIEQYSRRELTRSLSELINGL
jgi:hypothetical protein